MKLSLHYLLNNTMRPLAETYFLPFIPSGFTLVEHKCQIHTSGNFLEDNYRQILEERTRLIMEEIKGNPDAGLIFWCDVDVVFFADCAAELKHLAKENDLLFPRENSWNGDANFGLQIIRRNEKTLAFYSHLLQMQISGETETDQVLGNRMLRSNGGVTSSLLPLKYSSESNGGIHCASVLYHANCTGGNSVTKKQSQLEAACTVRRLKRKDEQSDFILNENIPVDSDDCPIYAYSAYGLGNRLLGLAFTMELCRIKQRPIVLVWESNFHVGNTHFNDLFENVIPLIGRKPAGVRDVCGGRPHKLSPDDLPQNRETVVVCNDVIAYPGINHLMARSNIQKLRPVSRLRMIVDAFTDRHDFTNVIGVHIRKGDKLIWEASKENVQRADEQYDETIRQLMELTSAKVFISCDDLDTVAKYKKQYDSRIISLNKRENPIDRNGGAISEAILDLYLLSKTKFIFYGVGTFGYVAHFISGKGGCNILRPEIDFFFLLDEIDGKSLLDPGEMIRNILPCKASES